MWLYFCKSMFMIRIFFLFFVFLFNACDDSSETKEPLADVSISPNIESINTNSTANYSTIETNFLDIESFAKKYKEFMESKNADSKDSKASELDKEFLFLRKKYSSNERAIQSLKECCGCIKPDCSANIKEGEYFYANNDILEALNNILLDKNTQIFSDIKLLQKYEYVLKNKQTTSIDLQSLNTDKNTETNDIYGYIKFEWVDNNMLKVTLTPKENICTPHQYNIVTTFLQDNNGVKTTRYKEKLPMFLYPADLVLFVRQSCSCAMALGNISDVSKNMESNIEISEFKLDSKDSKNLQETMEFKSDIDSKNVKKTSQKYHEFLSPNIKYCDNLEESRANLWEKYMQDSRAIRILQEEQKMYKPQFYENTDISN